MPEYRPIPYLFTVAAVLACALVLGCAAESVSPETAREEAPPSTAAPATEVSRVTGQLLLPGDGGRRGLEMHVWIATPEGEERQLWILPDADGRFDRDVSGTLTRANVVAGTVVDRIDAADLTSVDGDGLLDLGTIDLRERLMAHRVHIRAPEGASGGMIRAGLWIGPPQRGPQGGLPSLGSAQFPNLALGNEVEWLLPPDPSAVYFLVERSASPSITDEWRGGEQYLFGPYASSDFPLELVLD